MMKKLLKYLRLIAAFIALAVCSHAFAQSEASALKMVQSLKLGSHLIGMSYNVSKVTQTHLIIAADLGTQKADEMLRAELIATAPKYQPQWDKNLALSWLPLLSDEEFESLATLKQQSPFASKFQSLTNLAGDSMRSKSEKLLTDLMTEVLTKNFTKYTESKKQP